VVQVEQVVASYRASYCAAGDIDELDFLSHEDYLVIPSLADRLVSQLHSVCVFSFLAHLAWWNSGHGVMLVIKHTAR